MRNSPPDGSPRPRLEVGFVLANRFTLTAFANFVDTLRLAADEGDRSRPILCRWATMSATGAPVTASCGVAVTPQSRFVDPRRFHYIVVVGGLLHAGAQIDAATGDYLTGAAEAGVPLVGVCTGSFVLARLGLLTGRKICVSWFHRQDFVDAFGGPAPIADRLYVIDGDRITCSGGAGVVDLAAALVERHVGARAARKSLDVLLLDGPRAADAAQPTPAFAQDVSDVRVRRAILLMEQTLAHPAPVAEIARKVGLSERQLDRLFRAELGESPAQTHRRMRGDYGRWLLVNTDRSVFEIATMAGFVDGAHFAREMRRRHGASPTALRAGGARAAAPAAAAGRLFS